MALQTPRLILRQRRDGDARALFDAYCSDPLCARYLARRAHTDVAQTEKVLLDYCQASKSTPGAPFVWVISLKTSEAPIGLFIANPHGHRTEIHFEGVLRKWLLRPQAGVGANDCFVFSATRRA